ncbi:hypothetical protein A9Q99_08180 [Gammaproteobacteria bacterium 45_16_T64]|nr:hypothetical protein A9Q99_08180 [Gammaproteobacteria bacterium 45_16_T64]
MESIISNVTSTLLTKALDVVSQEHKAIANNIANVDTLNYRAMHVDFDQVFASVSDVVISGDKEALSQVVGQLGTMDLPTVEELSTQVVLDSEMVRMTENTMRYQALIGFKKGLGALTGIAINGGRS